MKFQKILIVALVLKSSFALALKDECWRKLLPERGHQSLWEMSLRQIRTNPGNKEYHRALFEVVRSLKDTSVNQHLVLPEDPDHMMWLLKVMSKRGTNLKAVYQSKGQTYSESGYLLHGDYDHRNISLKLNLVHIQPGEVSQPQYFSVPLLSAGWPRRIKAGLWSKPVFGSDDDDVVEKAAVSPIPGHGLFLAAPLREDLLNGISENDSELFRFLYVSRYPDIATAVDNLSDSKSADLPADPELHIQFFKLMQNLGLNLEVVQGDRQITGKFLNWQYVPEARSNPTVYPDYMASAIDLNFLTANATKKQECFDRFQFYVGPEPSDRFSRIEYKRLRAECIRTMRINTYKPIHLETF